MNIFWSARILSSLHSEGVRDVVFCPGARNSPFITTLAKTHGFELHSFFEERAASFYALGLARRTGQPVVVLTTSGTAAAECLPAVIEAFHTGVPLVVLTADRPKRLRGTGAPQAIDQTGLFAKFIEIEFDLENGELFSCQGWSRRAPLHLNVCFDEPLIDEPASELELQPAEARPSFSGTSKFSVSSGAEWAILRLTKFLRSPGTLVAVVGTLETEAERESVAEFLKRLKAPAYLEATSGLRERMDLKDLALTSGEHLLAWGLKRGFYSRVLRIGGVPTVRIWRDLDLRDSQIEIFSLTSIPFAGLSRGEMICSEIALVLDGVQNVGEVDRLAGALLVKDRSSYINLMNLYLAEPRSEPALVHALSQNIPDSALVYLGNSLPIRQWDLAADRSRPKTVEANRGVNGIDGQVATFLGLARRGIENWAIIGDLTALYDLTAPWALKCREEDLTVRIVVLNNGGGQIFSRLFKADLFINRHGLNFASWASMWGLGYQRWTEVPQDVSQSLTHSRAEIIEVVPDELATNRFWNRYEELWV